MTRHTLLIVAPLCLFICAAACSPPPTTEYRPASTIKDIMDSIVDPSADGIWDSVEVIATLQGTTEKSPKTDDDWKALRRHAIALIEASNLLVMPGRHIAQPGEKAEDARIDMHPEVIEALVSKDRASWTKLAFGLQDAGVQNLKAITARDVKQLIDAGEVLDMACESCHKKYWYRNDPNALPSQGSQ